MPQTRSGAPYLNNARYWAHFGRFADVGGKREPLVPKGAALATKDFAEASRLYVEREQHYLDLRERRARGEATDNPSLPEYTARFLERLAGRRDTRNQLLYSPESLKRRKTAILHCLRTPALQAVDHFSELSTKVITSLIADLQSLRQPDGEAYSPSTLRGWLMELSAMLESAKFDGYMKSNPIREHRDVPVTPKNSALDPDKFLLRAEVAGLLDNLWAQPGALTVEAGNTLAYTGMRLTECTGMRVCDVDLTTNRVRVVEYRGSKHPLKKDGVDVSLEEYERLLKTRGAQRFIPLWPKLRAMLEPLVTAALDDWVRAGHRGVCTTPLFPGRGKTGRIGGILGSLRTAAQRAGIRKTVTHYTLRHSYATARLQMTAQDSNGHLVPVSDAIIASELGHTTPQMLHDTYAHVVPEQLQQHQLDYFERAVLPEERAARRRADFGARISEGVAARKRRIKQKDAILAEDRGSAARKPLAQKLRALRDSAGWTPAEFALAGKATAGEAAGILGGDHGRLTVTRMREILEAATHMAKRSLNSPS